MELGKVKLRDTFNYQIDIVVPNVEKNFDIVRKEIFDQHKFFLLKNVNLATLLSKEFRDYFLLKNGKLYLMSYDTKLDCNDCACLIPNGILILNVTKSTSQKLPIEPLKNTVKSTGYDKYEFEISLNELANNDKKLNKFRPVFESMSFSFYACWRRGDNTENNKISARKDLQEFFGSQTVLDCLNRVDSKVLDCPVEMSERILNVDLSQDGENWIDVDNLIGCLINNIDL